MTAYDAKGSGNGVTAEATKYLYESAVNASWQTAWSIPTTPSTSSSQNAAPAIGRSPKTAATTPRPTTTGSAASIRRPTSGASCIRTPTTPPAGFRRTPPTAPGGWGDVDHTVQAIGTTYDELGRVQSTASYADTAETTVLNQVFEQYDAWGNLVQGMARPRRRG